MTHDSSRQPWQASTSTDVYATASDFRSYFASERTQLFRLALLLTADAKQAECCFTQSMNECLSAEQVHKGWISLWTRRTIARNGIRLAIAGQHKSTGQIADNTPASTEPRQSPAELPGESAGIFTLDTFDRLVYVLSTIEGYSTADCALLLLKPPREIHQAEKRALIQVASFEEECHRISNAAPIESSMAVPEYEPTCGALLK